MVYNMDRLDIDTLLRLPTEELIMRADRVRREEGIRRVELCGIINARSGSCGEDCRFCAQSAHYRTGIPEYPLMDRSEIVAGAIQARKNGAERFGIVTSGRRLTEDEVQAVAETIREINERVGISTCASLGALDERSFSLLKEAGLKRYHHNIETSRRFYGDIVSTHDHSERVNTVKTAKKMGFEVCSGGIIGMGETWRDRIDMALLLKELDVDAVPVNMLIPVKGTPLEGMETIAPFDAVRTIAFFRIILCGKAIKIAAGMQTVLKDFGALAFMAGADGMMTGGYLTAAGRPVEDDLALTGAINGLWREE